MSSLSRTPPPYVRKRLRQEIGFGCPVAECGLPYLEYHHFDPPWHVRQHHNPDGMIALCVKHHPMADAGAFTREQLLEMKRPNAWRVEEIKGRFEWMRRDLLGVVGGSFYYRVPTLVVIDGEPVIWINRDEAGYLLLNLRMPSPSEEPRMVIEDNDWIEASSPRDLVCQPSGRIIEVRYDSGDFLRVEFHDVNSAEDGVSRYPAIEMKTKLIAFPIAAIDVHMKVTHLKIDLKPTEALVGGSVLSGNFIYDCPSGLHINRKKQ